MKIKIFVRSLVAILLFLAGVFLELAFSSSVLWGEIETRVYTPKSDSLSLAVKCPLVLSTNETGSISTVISNSLNEEALPVVTASISHNNIPQEISDTLTLAPHASKSIQWHVDTSNLIFDRLILAGISQMSYSDLPGRQGYCSILVLHFLGLNGTAILILLCSISLLCIIAGGIIWLRIHAPLKEADTALAQPFVGLAVLATLGVITALLRWWGLIILLDGLTLILAGVICTEVLLNPQPRRQ